jgi:hypothetical protein
MDPVFETYFRERFQQEGPPGLYISSPFPPPGGDWPSQAAHFIVRSAIDRTRATIQSRGGIGLRADAALLLYLAFTELVARPVIVVRGPVVENDLSESIAADVALITERAMDARKGEAPVSAHDIINATATLWPELRSSGWEVWD